VTFAISCSALAASAATSPSSSACHGCHMPTAETHACIHTRCAHYNCPPTWAARVLRGTSHAALRCSVLHDVCCMLHGISRVCDRLRNLCVEYCVPCQAGLRVEVGGDVADLHTPKSQPRRKCLALPCLGHSCEAQLCPQADVTASSSKARQGVHSLSLPIWCKINQRGLYSDTAGLLQAKAGLFTANAGLCIAPPSG
jgi:hypothetical protein